MTQPASELTDRRSRRKRSTRLGTTGLAVLCGAVLLSSAARATDVGVAGARLNISVNTNSGAQRLTSVQKGAGVAFGAGPNIGLVSGNLEVVYLDGATSGTLAMPAPWLSMNSTATLARFKNPSAPLYSPVFSATVRKGKTATVSAKALGGLSLASAPGPAGVLAVLTVLNGNDGSTTRMCTRYSAADGSSVSYRSSSSGYRLSLRKGVAAPCPSCTNSVRDGTETGVDCGGGTCVACGNGQGCNTGTDCASGICSSGICQSAGCTDNVKNGTETDTDCGGGACPTCGDGSDCQVNTDCTSSICGAFVCQPGNCTDGVRNGAETDVDCGGGTCPDCGVNDSCNVSGDCQTGLCDTGVCRCPGHLYTFTVNSNSGGAFDSAEWPGGTTSQTAVPGCSVTINRPNDNIDLVCALAAPFSVNSFAGYSSCAGTGGEDGDGCQPVSCPPAGIGSCCNGRPSCSAALNGSGSANYRVQCNP